MRTQADNHDALVLSLNKQQTSFFLLVSHVIIWFKCLQIHQYS